jgi:hypothetical protein
MLLDMAKIREKIQKGILVIKNWNTQGQCRGEGKYCIISIIKKLLLLIIRTIL